MTDDKNTLEALLEAAYLWRDSKGEEYGRACSVLWNAVDAHREALADARPCGMEGYDSPPFECGCGVQFKCVRKDDVFSLEVLRDNGPGTGPREVGHKYPDLQALVDEEKPLEWRRYRLRKGWGLVGDEAPKMVTLGTQEGGKVALEEGTWKALFDVDTPVNNPWFPRLRTPTIEARRMHGCNEYKVRDPVMTVPDEWLVPSPTFEALFEPANRFTFPSGLLLTDADLQEFGTREFKETQRIMQEAYDKERNKRPPTTDADEEDELGPPVKAWEMVERYANHGTPYSDSEAISNVVWQVVAQHLAQCVMELRRVLGEDAFGRGDTVMSRHDNIRSAHNTVVGRCNNLDDLVEHLEQSLGVESDTVKRLMERVAALEREPSTSMMPEGPKAAVTGPICPCGCYTTEWRDGKDHCSHCGREIVAAVDMGTATRELGSVTVERMGERVKLMPGEAHTFHDGQTMSVTGDGDVSWTKETR